MESYRYPFKDVNHDVKLVVWKKGQIIPNYDPSIWRRDMCGFAMRYSDHGNTQSEFGWEIDHVRPRALGGQTSFVNLQPLYWKNNRTKGDTYPWSCALLTNA